MTFYSVLKITAFFNFFMSTFFCSAESISLDVALTVIKSSIKKEFSSCLALSPTNEAIGEHEGISFKAKLLKKDAKTLTILCNIFYNEQLISSPTMVVRLEEPAMVAVGEIDNVSKNVRELCQIKIVAHQQ